MSDPNSKSDDLDAVRAIVEALRTFQSADQRRIIRWAQEKLGLQQEAAPPIGPAATAYPGASPAGSSSDIRTFLQSKRPSSDNQFATAVAYYYAFEAPNQEKKPEITSSDLQDAARLSGRARLHNPGDTLHNALKKGYLDKGQGRGAFKINTVGENLVAMAMPAGESGKGAAKRIRPKRKPIRPKTQPRRAAKEKK